MQELIANICCASQRYLQLSIISSNLPDSTNAILHSGWLRNIFHDHPLVLKILCKIGSFSRFTETSEDDLEIFTG